ncbi:MAG: hypothetical protein ABW189_01810 [Rickettsiales bacterium]
MRKKIILGLFKEIFFPERYVFAWLRKRIDVEKREPEEALENDDNFADRRGSSAKYVPPEAHVFFFCTRLLLLVQLLYHAGFFLEAPFLKPFFFPQSAGLIPLGVATAEWNFSLSCTAIPDSIADVNASCMANFTLIMPIEAPDVVLYVNVTVPPHASFPLKNETAVLSAKTPGDPNVTIKKEDGYYKATFIFTPHPLQRVTAFFGFKTVASFEMKNMLPGMLKKNLPIAGILWIVILLAAVFAAVGVILTVISVFFKLPRHTEGDAESYARVEMDDLDA